MSKNQIFLVLRGR